MAKYQQYAEYKDSGVEWLGKIPHGWKVLRGKYVFQEFRERSTTGEEVLLSVSEYYGVKPRSEKISEGDHLSRAESLVDYKKCYKNDLVMNIMLAWKRGLGVSKYDGIVSPAYSVFRFNEDIHPYFMHHLFRTDLYTSHFKTRSTGVIDSRLRLYPESFLDTEILIPSYKEQVQIANFLDHQTAQIDTLIEKQKTLIKLLKEKRQAVISHAVTKGLNPDAPMKNSGVEWLGEVPEHWEVSKLKYYSSIQGGYAFSSDSFTEEGVQILKIGNVYQNRLALERQPTFVPEVMLEALPDFIVKDGDILMSLTGTLGKRDYGFAVAIKDDGKYLLNQRVAKLNPADEKIDRDFLLNVLWSESYLNQLYSLPSGTKQANLSNSDVLDIVITLPPSKTEQKEIAVELQNQKDIFDKAIQKAMTSIELMQERRTALISAAVTGKIDVRGWQVVE